MHFFFLCCPTWHFQIKSEQLKPQQVTWASVVAPIQQSSLKPFWKYHRSTNLSARTLPWFSFTSSSFIINKSLSCCWCLPSHFPEVRLWTNWLLILFPGPVFGSPPSWSPPFPPFAPVPWEGGDKYGVRELSRDTTATQIEEALSPAQVRPHTFSGVKSIFECTSPY